MAPEILSNLSDRLKKYLLKRNIPENQIYIATATATPDAIRAVSWKTPKFGDTRMVLTTARRSKGNKIEFIEKLIRSN